MRMTEARLQSTLCTRLGDLSEWLLGALEIGELRGPEVVRLAKDAFMRWLCEMWDGNGGDTEGALVWALECYVESGSEWANGRSSLETDLSLSAEPAWELSEFHLLVASLLADQALLAFKQGTKKQLLLAAMLYADAIECREHWEKLRGPAGARNPNTRPGELHTLSRSLDEEIAGKKARKQVAQKGAEAKLANDPKQAAKSAAWELWPRAKEKGWTAVRFHTELTNIGHEISQDTVRKWLTKLRNTGTC